MAVPASRTTGLGRPARSGARATPRPASASRPPLRLVRRGARVRMLPFVLLSAVLVGALVLALTSAQALVGQGAFRLSELERRMERLELQNDMLRLRAARVSSPERIADAARRAGLVVPAQVEVLEG